MTSPAATRRSGPDRSPPRPLRQFVLKVHSRCDLACDHCYIYEHADQTWLDRPRCMTPETVRMTAARIAEHADRHGLSTLGVVLHGGEPLLMGLDRLRDTLVVLRRTIAPSVALDLRMQTNGLRLTPAMCELMLEHGVQVGVSLDGDRSANDRHRRFRNGDSSHAQARRALAMLRRPRFRPLYAGILCTVDIDNDPIAVYEALLAERPPRVDLLLPHATWDTPPPHAGRSPAPYAAWLGTVHRRWLDDGRPMRIRLFDSLRATAAGGTSVTEAVGVDLGDVVVVETDGAWEQPDSMKTAFHGAAATGRTVFNASADQVLALPAMRHRQGGTASLSAICRRCPVVRRCGGGLYAHRFRRDTGFDNPSVYCEDLKELIATTDAHRGTVRGRDTARRPDLGGWPDGRPGDRPDGRPGAVPDGRLPGMLEELATGAGDAACVARLAAAQEEITRALVVDAAARSRDALTSAAWSVLTRLGQEAPQAVRRVLAHPFVRPWAVQQMRATARPEELSRFADLAAAAVLAAEVPAQVEVTPRGGRIHLPTLGTVVLPDAGADRALVTWGPGGGSVRWPGGRIALRDGRSAPADGWLPARTVTVDDGTELLLEDADPYRDCHDRPAADRLGDAAAGRWQAQLRAAWDLLRQDAPAYAAGLHRGLRVITPLQPAAGATLRSAVSQHPFGAVGVAATGDPAALAVLLLQEFQHTKLGAVLDLWDLIDPADLRTVAVGWRPDPRPVAGVLQGAYAHLAVAAVWRQRSARSVAGAAGRYRVHRRWTSTAIRALLLGDALTPAGRRFVTRMADALERPPT